MIFNRNTIILVVFALGLGILVYWGENKDDNLITVDLDENQEATSSKIFPFSTAQLKKLMIETPEDKISFSKTNAEIHPWRMTSPQQTKASDAAIAFLTNLFQQSKNEVSIPASEENLSQYGLNQPQGKIKLILDNGNQYQIHLGTSNFDNSKIYALVIFPQSHLPSSQIFLVSKSFQYAIQRDFEEWIDTEDIEKN